MPFRPLRSRAFWFSLPGLVFLLWGWWDSMSQGTHLSIEWKKSFFSDSVMNHAGSLSIIHWPDSLGGDPIPRSFRVNRMRRGDAGSWFPKLKVDEVMVISGSVFRAPKLILPHWFLLFLYLVIWAGLLGWRARIWHRHGPGAFVCVRS